MGLNDNKSPWANGASINTENAPPLDEVVNRRFATEYLAKRLPKPYDSMRNLRDRIGQKINTACGNGKLDSLNGTYFFGDLVEWARSRKDFASAVADILIPNTGNADAVAPTFSIRAFGYSLPTMLPECQAALADAYRDLNALREENYTLRSTVANLTPLEVKAKARSEAARCAGKKGGRGNIR
jgi:hypothetical protein